MEDRRVTIGSGLDVKVTVTLVKSVRRPATESEDEDFVGEKRTVVTR